MNWGHQRKRKTENRIVRRGGENAGKENNRREKKENEDQTDDAKRSCEK